MKPCTTVSFSVAVDTFHISETEETEETEEPDNTETETVESTSTNKNGSDDSLLLIQFSRLIKYETVRVVAHSTHYVCQIKFIIFPLQEDYIVKQVDLLSGFGGAVGLWLGWSALTLGHFLVQTVKTINSVTIFK